MTPLFIKSLWKDHGEKNSRCEWHELTREVSKSQVLALAILTALALEARRPLLQNFAVQNFSKISLSLGSLFQRCLTLQTWGAIWVCGHLGHAPGGGRDWTVVHTYPGSRQGLRWSCLITDSVFSAFLYSSRHRRRCLWSQMNK